MPRSLRARTVGSLAAVARSRPGLASATLLALVLLLVLTADPAAAVEVGTDPSGVGDVSSGP